MKRFVLPLIALALLSQGAAGQSTIFLVRHAEKAQATADEKDPELSEAGRSRAESLAQMLKDAGIIAIYVTEFKRTQQTAQSLARAIGVKETIVPAKDTAVLISKLKETKGHALVIGHSNTLSEIVGALGSSLPITIAEADYDNLFVMTLTTPPRLLSLHYR